MNDYAWTGIAYFIALILGFILVDLLDAWTQKIRNKNDR